MQLLLLNMLLITVYTFASHSIWGFILFPSLVLKVFFFSACWQTAAILSQTNMNCWIQMLLFTFACSWSHQLWVSSFLAAWPCLSATVIDRWQSPSAVNLTRIAPNVHKISIETVFHAGFAAYYWWPEVHLKVLSVSSEWGPHIPLLYKLYSTTLSNVKRKSALYSTTEYGQHI